VPHVAHNTAILHLVHVFPIDNILIAGGRDHNIHVSDHFVQLHNPKAIHAAQNEKGFIFLFLWFLMEKILTKLGGRKWGRFL
jgi:hypothetical protein